MQPDHRHVVGTRLLAAEAALVDAFVGAIGREIPAYAELDGRQMDEVRSITAWTLRRVLELWVEDDALSQDDIALFRGVGAVRARDGRPLAAVLRAYRVGAGEFLNQVTDRFGDELSTEDVTSLVRVWFAVLDELSEAIYDGYESTGRHLGADRDSSLRALLTDLLLGRQSHAGTLAGRLRELDAQLPTTFELVEVAPTAALDARDAARLVAGALEQREDPPTMVAAIDAVLDGRGVVLLRSVDAAALAGLARDHDLRVVRQSRVMAREASRAHRLAAHALDRAPAFAWDQRGVLDGSDLEAVALVTGHPDADAARLRRAVLGGVDDPDALRTLQAVIECDGAAPAAERLHLHPQTVRYRMRRLAAATGRDPRTPWDRYVLQTALLAEPA